MRPKKHHHIPAFYLKRWAIFDSKIVEFSEPRRSVINPQRRHPNATGYTIGTYNLVDFPPHLASQVEENFFSKVDQRASNALDNFDRYPNQVNNLYVEKCDWVKFILSLFLRCPEDIDLLRAEFPSFLARTTAQQEEAYRRDRQSHDPETLAQFLSALSKPQFEKSAFEILMKLINHSSLIQKLSAMHWEVHRFESGAHLLLTSDRPVIRTSAIGDRGGHLALPLSPHSLLLVSHGRTRFKQGYRATSSEVNKLVVGAAVRQVYGSDERHLKFIKAHFGKTPQASTLKSLMSNQPQIVPLPL